MLKLGGKLVVVTPNVKSLGRKIFRESWRGLELSRHPYLSSLQKLRTCAEQAGLTVKMLCTTVRSSRGIWTASRILQKEGKLPGGSIGKLNWQLRLAGASRVLVIGV